jgi:site-specific DNA-methyltransferase (adenine-specific)
MIELHNCDCLDFMRTMPDKSVDAVITDPPYGIGVTKMTLGNGFSKIYRGSSDWDVLPDVNVFEEMKRISNKIIIWGGNYFASSLPNSRCWLVWDKHTGSNSFADCELAWTNIDSVIKLFSYAWVGANAKDTQERYHPTQKPVMLMKWCIEQLPKDVITIFDPFMGSGTTGVACVQTGRNFIGCEIDAGYFKIAEKRIHDAQQQLRLAI